MRKLKIYSIILVLLMITSLIGCAKKENNQTDIKAPELPTDGSLLVSNLQDESSRTLLEKVFKAGEVPEARTQVFWDHVDQFNQTEGMKDLIEETKTMKAEESAFDEYELQDIWSAAHPDFSGYNCRITAYTLMGDEITIKDTQNPDGRNTFIDEQSLQEDASALVEPDDLEKFKALFSTIEGADSSDQEEQIKKVQEAWEKRGISFDESSHRSLITLYIHARYDESDNELFVGHTGVLFDMGDQGLYFVEKLAFQAPYRLVYVKDRDQLKTYLLDRYATYYGEEEAAPFVLENGKVL